MSAQREGGPWGTVLVLLTLLAVANVVFAPFDHWREDESSGSGGLTAEAPDPLARDTFGWTSPARATITPGVQTITGGTGQCTTNFVFTDRAGEVYLGQSAHCARLDGDEINGCRACTHPLGTRVVFTVGTTIVESGRTLGAGRLAYSSWRSMQARGVRDKVKCAFNDFALVRVDKAHRDRVNPTMPYWGGPTGVAAAGVSFGDGIYGYGRSSWRTEESKASRQSGTVMSGYRDRDMWSHTIASRSPGVPGDSGSGYIDDRGQAVGTLSTMSTGSALISNGVSDLARQLVYARRHSGIKGLRLELGTKPFNRERAARSQRSSR